MLLSACARIPAHEARVELADAIAAPANLRRADISTSSYTFATWRRIGHAGAPIRVYIAGDGLAWLTRHDPSPDPTPINPVALRLASADSFENVVFIARPCQYTADAACAQADWTSERFSPAIVTAFNAALDALAAQYGAPAFELVGISGGANIAGLLAARRSDIANIRTVAGDIDNHAFIAVHDLSPMPLSLDMADEAQNISHLPQNHFVGGNDDVVPPAIARSYAAKTQNGACVNIVAVANAAHETGWVAQWPRLLAMPFSCGKQ